MITLRKMILWVGILLTVIGVLHLMSAKDCDSFGSNENDARAVRAFELDLEAYETGCTCPGGDRYTGERERMRWIDTNDYSY